MFRFIFVVLGVILGSVPVAAAEPWMPERPSFQNVFWDLPTTHPQGCAAISAVDHPLFARMARMAGIPKTALYLCNATEASAWTLPPRAVAVTAALARLPYCQKAFVLGHELGHLAMRHAEETANALRIVAHLPTSRASDAFSAADYDFSLLLDLGPLLRAQEQEADRLGALLSAGIGCHLEESGLAYLGNLPAGRRYLVLKTHDAADDRVRALEPFAPSAAAIAARAAVSEKRPGSQTLF